MDKRGPTIQTLKTSEARQQFSSLLNQVYRQETRVVVERSGIPVAAIVSADDLRRLTEDEAQRAKDFEILAAIGERFKDVPEEEIEREVAKAIAEVRAENRQRERDQARSA